MWSEISNFLVRPWFQWSVRVVFIPETDAKRPLTLEVANPTPISPLKRLFYQRALGEINNQQDFVDRGNSRQGGLLETLDVMILALPTVTVRFAAEVFSVS